jgi:uncharacterized protein YfiM (DUF2279 family)
MSNSILLTGAVQVVGGGLAAPKFAFAAAAAGSTDIALVAAVSGKRIRVLDVKVSTAVAVTGVVFNSKPTGAGVAISATFQATVGVSGFGLNQLGHFETAVGEGLSVSTGAGNTVAVQITYIEV